MGNLEMMKRNIFFFKGYAYKILNADYILT